MIDVLPGQFGDVHQAVHATQVDECAEVDDRGDGAVADLSLLQGVEEVGANLGLRLLEPCAARQDHVVAVLVELDDLGFKLAADVGLQVTHATHLNQGCGQEAAQADVEDQAALDDLDDSAGDNTFFFLDLFDLAPCAFVLCALLRQKQAAILVFLLEYQSFDLITHRDDVIRIDVMLDG